MSSEVLEAEVAPEYLVEAEADESGVPAGYKQTEVGVIPEDWEVCELQDAVEFLDGLRRPIKSGDRAKISGIYPYYGASGVVDYVNDYIFDDELILLGEDGENILSRNLPLAFRVSGKIWVNNHAHVMKPKSHFDIGYLTEFLECLDYSLLNSGTAQPKLNKQTCLKIKVARPSQKEQTAIANALSDVDTLICKLEKLIAKKQAIKTATMQQLLTGRTRLPQFALHEDGSKKGYKQSELGEIPEDWEVRAFGELIESSIQRKSKRSFDYVTFVGMQDVTENAQLVNQTIIQYEKVKSGFTYFEKGDVLVAKITPCFENGKGCHTEFLETDIGFGSTEFHVLRATVLSDSKFIYFWTTRNSVRTALESEMVGSAGHRRVPFAAVQDYQIPCPGKKEQTAIATILSDMDKEIQALDQRLAKTRQIKQGMMQELLTGKTRLVMPNQSI
ncbi:restriction endonuclease subunit S [Zooshikella harenae]|uniref:Restriction endonuclease subunit S n=1 Tax=Zooshikella harenae TaxID=2827238 RepID=A0ABS5ZHT1_9GAMM|nr:restriction endonuclease subunit S [Zooshikella harenae]MBU2712815.1 restriction endonuclease subunit S [Zooshikella harenae]